MTRLTDTLTFGPGLDIAARSSASIGPLHALENQDNLLVIDANGRAAFLRDQVGQTVQLDDWPRGHVRVAVLDGMGGHGQGRQAAEAVAAGLLDVPACATLEQLCVHLDALHTRLQAQFLQPHVQGLEDCARRPGTTLTLLEIPPGQAPLLYHVGDSRLYEITAQAAQPLTVDHVPATAYAMRGLLGAQEWWQQVHGEHRAQISQAFILGNAFANPQQLDEALYRLDAGNLPAFLRALPDRRVLTVRHDAVYLLATDGFWSCGRPQDWTACWPALLAPAGPPQSARELLDSLYEAFAHAPPPDLHVDNLSAAVLRFTAPAKARGRNDNIEETALPNAVFTPLF